MPSSIVIDSERLSRELQTLATFSACPEPPPAVTRVVFSEADRQARAYLGDLFEAEGLQVRVDPIGNTFARWIGSETQLPAVGTGSHIDAIPYAGLYDGTVGVLGGLEALRALKRAGFQPRRSLEVVLFTSEEPTRFGMGCTGSRLMCGTIAPDKIAALIDEAGVTLDVARQQAGYQGDLREAILPDSYFHAWLELHIEQGPELEERQLDIGIVTAIAAPASLIFKLEGEGGHAGAVLMPNRRDALCAAAEMITRIESVAYNSPSPDLVATVGMLHVHPNAVNSIPSRTEFTLDIRDIDHANRDHCMRRMIDQCETIAFRRNIQLDVVTKNSDPPAVSARFVTDAIEVACQTVGASYQRMISRAYHDSLFMARVAPTSMIFIPCRKGISHRPDEYTSPSQIARGVEVLATALADLSR